MKSRAELEVTLESFSTALDDAVFLARELARECKDAGLRRLSGEIEAYTIGNLQSFGTEHPHQMGSVDSIMRGLEDLEE